MIGVRTLGQTLPLVLAATISFADAPGEQANRSFDAYAASARDALLRRNDPVTRHESVLVRAGRDGGIMEVPGGLVHHWVGRVFIPGVTLKQALEVSLAFPEFRKMYRSVIASRLLGREGETYRILLRVREGLLGVNAILDIRSRVEVIRNGDRRVCIVSGDEEIREVENAGRADERLLAPDEGSGYLRRSGLLTSLVEDSGGVHVEIQTLGLSRDFPFLLRWVTDAISKRIGRKSVEDSLEDFRAALRSGAEARR